MTTPSEETILAAARNCGFATFGGAFTALDTELIALYRAAYAAGVRAGMERAAGIVRARYMGDNNREDMEAKRCADAIRSAAKGDM